MYKIRARLDGKLELCLMDKEDEERVIEILMIDRSYQKLKQLRDVLNGDL